MANTTGVSLAVVARNSMPNREPRQPATWILNARGRDAIKMTVVRDAALRPRIISKDAA